MARRPKNSNRKDLEIALARRRIFLNTKPSYKEDGREGKVKFSETQTDMSKQVGQNIYAEKKEQIVSKSHRPPPFPSCNDPFCEPKSAPEHLIPKHIKATTSSVRFSNFFEEMPIDDIKISIDTACVSLPVPSKTQNEFAHILTGPNCPVYRLGYFAGHVQDWSILDSALGELVHSMSLAPGESRNVAILDWRRWQTSGRGEETSQAETFIHNVTHSRAINEVASAVAAEQQAGDTFTFANSVASSAAMVGAAAAVGGVAGGIIGTVVEPGGGTLIGAAVGGVAGVAAGGAVVAGASTIGTIISESSGDRDVISRAHQRITQSTEQQSANVRSIRSSVVVEDAQEEEIRARSTNITNYNHMHSLNMQYYEVLHEYKVRTHLETVESILYVPYTTPDQFDFDFIKSFWRTFRLVLPKALLDKGDEVFILPSPIAPIAPDGTRPTPPADKTGFRTGHFNASLKFPFGADLIDILNMIVGGGIFHNVVGDIFKTSVLRIERSDGSATIIHGQMNTDLHRLGTAVANFFAGNSNASDPLLESGITFHFNRVQNLNLDDVVSIKIILDSPFLANAIEEGARRLFDAGLKYRFVKGSTIVNNAASPSFVDNSLQNVEGTLIFSGLETSEDRLAWNPLSQFDVSRQAEWNAYNAENKAWIQYDLDRLAFETRKAELAAWRSEIMAEINSGIAYYTRALLSLREDIVANFFDNAYFYDEGQDSNSPDAYKIPLVRIVDTNPIGFTDRFILLKMREPRHIGGLPKDIKLQEVIEILAEQFGLPLVDSGLLSLLIYPFILRKRFEEDREELDRVSTVYLPAQGLFAEAVLGQSNSAEFLDLRRFWNWQDSPIPNAAPNIAPVQIQSFARDPLDTAPETQSASIQPQNVQFTDFQGLANVLQAVQNGGMFRDMSKSAELANIIQGLTKLAGDMGQTAAQMTGEAAEETLQQATNIGKAAADLARDFAKTQGASSAPTSPPQNITEAGGVANITSSTTPSTKDLGKEIKKIFGPTGDTSTASKSPQSGASSPANGEYISPNEVITTEKAREKLSEIIEEIEEKAQDTDTVSIEEHAGLRQVIASWYKDTIEPRLRQAQYRHDDILPAISEYLEWEENVQQFGLHEFEEFTSYIESARYELALPGLVLAFNQMQETIKESSDLFSHIGRMVELKELYQALGGDEILDFNVNALIDITEISPNEVGLGDIVKIKGQVGCSIDGGNLAHDMRFRIQSDCIQAKPRHSAWNTTSSGEFELEIKLCDEPFLDAESLFDARPQGAEVKLQYSCQGLEVIAGNREVSSLGKLQLQFRGNALSSVDTPDFSGQDPLSAVETSYRMTYGENRVYYRLIQGLYPLAGAAISVSASKNHIVVADGLTTDDMGGFEFIYRVDHGNSDPLEQKDQIKIKVTTASGEKIFEEIYDYNLY